MTGWSRVDGDGFFINVAVDGVMSACLRRGDLPDPCCRRRAAATYDDAVALIRYANGTASFTRDGKTGRQPGADSIEENGMVEVNALIPVPIGAFSFGGWKRTRCSGDTDMYGPEAFNFYTRRKVVTTRWPGPQRKPDRSPGFRPTERRASWSSTFRFIVGGTPWRSHDCTEARWTGRSFPDDESQDRLILFYKQIQIAP